MLPRAIGRHLVKERAAQSSGALAAAARWRWRQVAALPRATALLASMTLALARQRSACLSGKTRGYRQRLRRIGNGGMAA